MVGSTGGSVGSSSGGGDDRGSVGGEVVTCSGAVVAGGTVVFAVVVEADRGGRVARMVEPTTDDAVDGGTSVVVLVVEVVLVVGDADGAALAATDGTTSVTVARSISVYASAPSGLRWNPSRSNHDLWLRDNADQSAMRASARILVTERMRSLAVPS